ncbi:hypothetical protein HFN47_35785 [Rhizobium leguminosarum]|nr:hypothetical protein [Rhizobium leguminosarum]
MNSVPRSKVIERRASWGSDWNTRIKPSITGLALSEMNDRGAGIAPPPGAKPLANLDRDVAAQVLLLIQGRAQTWV